MLPWLSPGQADVCALIDTASRYQRAVSSRSASLTAAEHFYRDLMVYQWRLDALDVQLDCIKGANRHGASVDEADDAQTPITPELALENCLVELDKQHIMAIAAIEERAEHYNFIA